VHSPQWFSNSIMWIRSMGNKLDFILFFFSIKTYTRDQSFFAFDPFSLPGAALFLVESSLFLVTFGFLIALLGSYYPTSFLTSHSARWWELSYALSTTLLYVWYTSYIFTIIQTENFSELPKSIFSCKKYAWIRRQRLFKLLKITKKVEMSSLNNGINNTKELSRNENNLNIYLGMNFANIDEFKEHIKGFMKSTRSFFVIRDSRPIQGNEITTHSMLIYKCKHGPSKHISESRGLRNRK